MVSGKLLALTGAALIAAATTAANATSIYTFNSSTGGLSWSNTTGFSSSATIDLTGQNGLGDHGGTTFSFSGFTAAGTATPSYGGYTQTLNAGSITITSSSSTILTEATVSFGGAIITVGGSGNVYIEGIVTSFSGDPSFLGLYTAPGSFGFNWTSTAIATTIDGDGYLVFSSQGIGGTISASEPGTSSVPLPAAAWGGLSLLGSMGAMRALRRRALKA